MDKKKLTVILMLTVLVIIAVAMFTLTACGGEEKEVHYITTIEELEEWTSGSVAFNRIKSTILVLENDLDFGNRRLDGGILCYEFRGNGHTISNVMLSGSFFSTAHIISDVTFEGLTLSRGTAFVLGSANAEEGELNIIEALFHVQKEKYGVKIDNVHVKNSTATITQGEKPGGFGGIVGVYADHNYTEKPTMTNCTVDNITCTIEAGANPEITGALWDNTPINVGGLIGVAAGVDISDCSVSDSTIDVTAMGIGNKIFLGGMIGVYKNSFNKSEVSGCYASNNSLSASGMWSSGNVVNDERSTSTVSVGGFICELNDNDNKNNTQFNACYSDGNDIEIQCNGLYNVGGFGANLYSAEYSECYAVDNTVVAGGRHTGDTSAKNRNFGGFAATGGGTITSCYSYNNSMTDAYQHQLVENEERNFGGFIGRSIGAVLTYCAAGSNDMSWGANTSSFCSYSSKNVFESCYCDDVSSNTALEPITESQFLDFSTFSDLLMLSDSRWMEGNGRPAILKLN